MKLSLVAIGVLALLVSRPAVAQSERSERTLTVPVAPTLKNISLSSSERALAFDKPVEIPGALLPPGAYLFRMIAPSTLQVTDVTRSKIYSTFMIIQTRRNGDTDAERVTFEIGDEALRLVGWYFGDASGYEFLYPRSKRKAIEEVRR